jgi:hypothetical protein
MTNVLNVRVIFDVDSIYFYYGFYIIYSPSYIRRMYLNSRFRRRGSVQENMTEVSSISYEIEEAGSYYKRINLIVFGLFI